MFDRIILLILICIGLLFSLTGIETIFNIAFFFLLLYALHEKKVTFDLGDIVLILGTLTYYLFSGSRLYDAIYFSIVYDTAYQLGKKIVCVGKYLPENKAMIVILTVAAARMISGVPDYLVRPKEATDSWIGWNGNEIVRTQYEMYLIMMAALLGFYILVVIKMKVMWGIIGVIASFASVYMGITTEGRFTLGCCLCGTGVVMILYFIENKSYRSKYGIIMILSIGIVILSLITAYIFNLFGYREIYENSFMAGSGGIFTNTRFSLMKQQIILLKDYPLGKCEVPLVEYNGMLTSYAHNFWLDIARKGGIIPAVLYLVFSATNIISMFKVWIYSNNINKYATIAGFVGTMVYSALEATIHARVYWSLIILIGGMLKGLTYICGSDYKRDDINNCFVFRFIL